MRDALDANTGALKPVGGTLAMLRVEKPVNIRDALLGTVLRCITGSVTGLPRAVTRGWLPARPPPRRGSASDLQGC